MLAKHAARELALILFSQIDINGNRYNYNFQDVIMQSIRTLTNSSKEDLEADLKEILSIKGYISDYESNHPQNLERPIEALDKPVPLPMTNEMQKKLDSILNIGERTMLALEIAEMTALEENSEVKYFIKQLNEQFKRHIEEIDSQIKKFAIGWDINRLVKMDKDILRIAICELMFIKKVPVKVVIDEAVELAKKYSTDDSPSFINGILAKVVLENNLK